MLAPMTSPYLLGDRAGFTPQIARLVGMMNYTRQTTLQAVQGLTEGELDLRPEGHGNSVGMLLEHFCAVEIYYQAATFGTHADPEDALGERWQAGINLGQLGQEQIMGHPLGYYLRNLTEIRAKTLRELAKRDDRWLEEPLPFWGDTGNRYFMWFHVFEDELNHRGQIRLLTQHLPSRKERGMLGAGFEPATPEGLGMRCREVWEGSPAAQAGLQQGDLVLEYDGQDVTERLFYELLLARPAGVSIRFVVRRGAERLELTVERVTVGG